MVCKTTLAILDRMEKTFEEEKTKIITASEERKDECADVSVKIFARSSSVHQSK